MAIDVKIFWKWLNSIAIMTAVWMLCVILRIWDQTAYLLLLIMGIFHIVSIVIPYMLYLRGTVEVQIGRVKYPAQHLAAEFTLFFGLCEWWIVFGPISNILPPNVPPFTWGLELLFYVIEAYVLICSLEAGVYALVKYKGTPVVIPDKKSVVTSSDAAQKAPPATSTTDTTLNPPASPESKPKP